MDFYKCVYMYIYVYIFTVQSVYMFIFIDMVKRSLLIIFLPWGYFSIILQGHYSWIVLCSVLYKLVPPTTELKNYLSWKVGWISKAMLLLGSIWLNCLETCSGQTKAHYCQTLFNEIRYIEIYSIVEEKAHAADIDIPNITIISQSIVDKEIHTAARHL